MVNIFMNGMIALDQETIRQGAYQLWLCLPYYLEILKEQINGWIAAGDIKWRETVENGIENAPRAFLNLFSGDNFGKMLVRLNDDASAIAPVTERSPAV